MLRRQELAGAPRPTSTRLSPGRVSAYLSAGLIAASLLGSTIGCRDDSSKASQSSKKSTGQTVADSSPRRPGARTSEPVGSGSTTGTTTGLQYVDIAAAAGLQFQFYADQVPGRFHLAESMGGAAAWFDFDLDGRLDAYLPNGCSLSGPQESDPPNTLFRGGDDRRFRNITGSALGDERSYSFGVAVGDFDVDGFLDLYVTGHGTNLLLRNNGDGTFSEIAEAAGVDDRSWGTGTMWFDANGDELPDLYVVNYLDVGENDRKCSYRGGQGYCGPQEYDPQPDAVYVNQGDGRFENATERLGFDVPAGYGLGVMAVDLDDDLVPEIVVANDMSPNFLFQKQGDGRWVDQAATAGVATSGSGELEAGMGIACADFDGDQRADLCLTHYHDRKNTLYRNLGGLVFADDSYRSRIAATSFNFLGFGVAVVDPDRNGAPDLLVANGHVLGPNHDPGPMRMQLLLNDGGGRFSDVSATAGRCFEVSSLGRGLATADIDNDGDRDALVVSLDRPAVLLEDRSEIPGNWIGFALRRRNRLHPAGARVVLRWGDKVLVLPVTSGGSYLCAPDQRLLTGVGTGVESVDVTVHWPAGQVSRHRSLATNRYWSLEEPAR